jgi:hypothetical protein
MASTGTTSASLAAHLGSLPGEIGCRHLARQRDDFDASILVSLGLVKLIRSGVPRCEEHGCPLIDVCEHVADFEPDASGSKAGVKYRPTADGLAASADPAVIDAATRALPAVETVLALLAGGPLTIFQLNTRLRETWSTDEAPPDRPELGQIVTLLVEVGQVRSEGAELSRV